MANRAAWEVQPAEETAASRKARDITQRGGDYNGATLDGDGEWVGNDPYGLAYAGPNTAGGRNGREYLARGGDFYLDDDGEVAYDANGRNDREYATPAPALVSAITGQRFAGWKNLQGSRA